MKGTLANPLRCQGLRRGAALEIENELKDLDQKTGVLGNHILPVEGIVVAYNPGADRNLRDGLEVLRHCQERGNPPSRP